MPKGKRIDWTLDQLKRIWAKGFDAEALAEEFGVSTASIYSMRARIKYHVNPERLFRAMQKTGPGGHQVETLENALARTYMIRIANSGRDGNQMQYSVTIPPTLAEPFIEKFGRVARWEPEEDGLLLVPLMDKEPDMPTWLEEQEDE